MLGEVGKGYKISIRNFERRPHRHWRSDDRIAARRTGKCARCWLSDNSLAKSINQFQGVQFQLAEMATELEAARLMVYNAARMKDAGLNFVKEAAMAKLYSSRVAERITSRAINCMEAMV